MRYLILGIVFMSILSGVGYAIFKAGKDSDRKECLQEQTEVIKDDTRRLANRPKSDADTINRLRSWGDRVKAAEDRAK